MTYSSRTFGVGGYHVGEKWMVVAPTTRQDGAPLVVVCHGAGGSADHYGTLPVRWRQLDKLAASGMVAVAADLGSVVTPIDGWGSDTAVARVDEVIAWAETTWGCDVTRVSLLGDSSGGATALNWARANPAQLGGVVLRCGVADVESIYQGGAGNPLLVDLIDEAYADTWPAQAATHDPAQAPADFVPIADRLRLYYSTDDGLVPAAGTEAFADAVGCRAIPIGAVDHDPMPYMPDDHVARWLWSLQP